MPRLYSNVAILRYRLLVTYVSLSENSLSDTHRWAPSDIVCQTLFLGEHFHSIVQMPVSVIEIDKFQPLAQFLLVKRPRRFICYVLIDLCMNVFVLLFAHRGCEING